MKNTIFLSALILYPILFFAQSEGGNTKELDPSLFGTWSGSENEQIMVGMESWWIQERFEDGTFMLLVSYSVEENGKLVVKHSSERGRWWVEDGMFYEYHFNSGLTDIYEYQVLDHERIRFTAKKMSFQTAAQPYGFIDYRVPDA